MVVVDQCLSERDDVPVRLPPPTPRDEGFESDDLKLSVALGRPVEEVEAWMSGSEPPDDDIIMKARAVAQERGIQIE